MKKTEVNVEELNEVISTGSKILRLFYALMIVLLVGGGIFILKTLNLLPILGTILRVIMPFFIGFILAWLLNPLINKLTDKGIKRGLSVALVYLLFAVVIYLFCLAVIPSLVDQLNDMVKMIPDYVTKITDWVDNFFTKLSKTSNIDMTQVKVELLNTLETFAKNTANGLPTKLINVVENVVSGIGKFLIGVIIGFYLSLTFNNSKKFIVSLFPKKIKKDVITIFDRISEVLYKFVNGTLLISLMLFIISLIGFSVIGLNAPVLFALFCAVTNVIPYVGPYLGGIPAVLVGFSQSPLIGILILVFIVVTQTIEGNILHPIVIGKKMDLHPVTIVISLLIFEHFFGIIGMIVATPIVAIIKILYEFFDEKYDFFEYTKAKSVKKEISKVNMSK